MDKPSNQKINRETVALDDTLDQVDLTNIFTTLHPKIAEYTFFSSVYGTCSRKGHTLGHKTNLHKFRKIEVILWIFSNHNTMKPEINHKKKCGKKHMEVKEYASKQWIGQPRNQRRNKKIPLDKWKWNQFKIFEI